MGFRIAFDTERNLVSIVVEGEIGLDVVRGYRAQVKQDPRYHAHMGLLIDLHAATPMLNTNEVIQAAKLYKSDPLASRLALVVTSDAFYGVARMFQMWAADEETVRIFHESDSALEWLGAAASMAP